MRDVRVLPVANAHRKSLAQRSIFASAAHALVVRVRREEEQPVKDGLLRLVAMGVEGAEDCVYPGHGKGSTDPG